MGTDRRLALDNRNFRPDNYPSWCSGPVFEEAWWRNEETPWTAHQIVKDGLDDYMGFAFQGGEHDEGYEAGIETFERWTGRNKVSLSWSRIDSFPRFARATRHSRLG